MERELFIITVYCLIVTHYQALTVAQPLRHSGFAPQLTDEEVITIEICGEYWKLASDSDLYDYFHAHWRHFFPGLRERTLFVRQAANLWAIKAQIQQRLVLGSGQGADPAQPIDTVPLPVCGLTRAPRERNFKPAEADYGYCAAKDLHYYGYKLGLRISRCGMIVHYPLLPARPHDVNHTGSLIEGHHGCVPADKAFWDPWRQQLYAARQSVTLLVPARANMTETLAPAVRRWAAYWRKRVETVGAQLTERFGLSRIRVRDLWHLQHRVIRKVLAHTVLVFLNLHLHRDPLDFDGLVVD